MDRHRGLKRLHIVQLCKHTVTFGSFDFTLDYLNNFFFTANPNAAGAAEVRGGREAESEVGERRPEERQGHQPRHLR